MAKTKLNETAENDDSMVVDQPTEAEGPVTEKGEYEELCQLVNAIAQPLANRKLAKKLYKLIKKASKDRANLRQGLADVQKAIRKDEKGLVVLAGNVSPIDVYSHIPGFCEEKELPYVFTPSREHLGLAAGHRRPAILMLIKRNDAYGELFDEIKENVEKLVVESV
ncbi:Protein Y48A6B.3 [Aphelenchoides avenae]|nr:Protein Y48A6B.3 [Aphelenchus avenae]